MVHRLPATPRHANKGIEQVSVLSFLHCECAYNQDCAYVAGISLYAQQLQSATFLCSRLFYTLESTYWKG